MGCVTNFRANRTSSIATATAGHNLKIGTFQKLFFLGTRVMSKSNLCMIHVDFHGAV
jgi:hypothetical protein